MEPLLSLLFSRRLAKSTTEPSSARVSYTRTLSGRTLNGGRRRKRVAPPLSPRRGKIRNSRLGWLGEKIENRISEQIGLLRATPERTTAGARIRAVIGDFLAIAAAPFRVFFIDARVTPSLLLSLLVFFRVRCASLPQIELPN